MPLDPNPELYPPYSGQSYVQIHEQNLKGLTISSSGINGHYGDYLNVTFGENQKYVLYGRNPRYEIARTIDAYRQNTEEFISSDTTLTAYLCLDCRGSFCNNVQTQT